jgi:predicted peptidase
VIRTAIFACVLLTGCAALGIDPAEFEPLPAAIPSDTTTRLANGTWVSAEGTRVRFTIVVPSMKPGDQIPLVLSLHGLASNGDTVPAYYGLGLLESLVGPALRPLGALIVAPDAPKNNWTDPVAERAVVGLIREMMQRYPIDTTRTLVTGFGAGGMGAWFLAGKHPKLFRAAVPLTSFPLVKYSRMDRASILAAYDEMVKSGTGTWTSPYRQVPVYAIHSRQDENVSFASESTLVAMIKARGGLAQLVAVDSLRHGPAILYQGALRAAVPWIRRQWARR